MTSTPELPSSWAIPTPSMFLTSLFKPVAYISLPVFIVRWITQQSPLARFWVRVAMYYTALSLTCVWGVLVSIPMSLAGEKLNVNYIVARSFAAFAGRLMEISFEVEGEEYLETRPAILVGNHQSGLDVLFLGRSVLPLPLPCNHNH